MSEIAPSVLVRQQTIQRYVGLDVLLQVMQGYRLSEECSGILRIEGQRALEVCNRFLTVQDYEEPEISQRRVGLGVVGHQLDGPGQGLDSVCIPGFLQKETSSIEKVFGETRVRLWQTLDVRTSLLLHDVQGQGRGREILDELIAKFFVGSWVGRTDSEQVEIGAENRFCLAW